MISPSSHSQALLPNPDLLILERIEREANRFRMTVRVEQEPTCPRCGAVSRSRHSFYSRRLQDLPWQGMAVELRTIAGRFRCRNAACPRQIFCERLPQIAQAYGRQTERAVEIVRLIGYVAGGLPGQRLLVRLAIATSADTGAAPRARAAVRGGSGYPRSPPGGRRLGLAPRASLRHHPSGS